MIGGADAKPAWTVLQHNGVMFSEPYIPLNIPVLLNGKEMILKPQAEEYALMFAKFIGTDYMENPLFKKNWYTDFVQVLDSNLKHHKLEEWDFTSLKNYLVAKQEKNKEMSKEEKERQKAKQAVLDEPYKSCIIDGVQQQVGNYKMEPSGIFLGRGTHPKIGRIKKRVTPEDVTLNLSKDAQIPKPNVEGEWGKIVHDNTVIWLATWKEKITGKNKYVFTSLDSFFKSASDESKFDLARKLKKKVGTIRSTYMESLKSEDMKQKQLATALYLIDNLALRVGGSKDTKEEADTVGVTSLRVEHIDLLENNMLKLDFLGKDSVRFCKKVKVDELVYNNMKLFSQNKKNKDEIFDLIVASTLNDYLSSFLEGLTAKVWRTYNASMVFQKELDKIKPEVLENISPNEKLNYLISMFNQANTEVALLCNHQKQVNANLEVGLDKINDRIKELRKKKTKTNNKDKLKSYTEKINSLKLKKDTKEKMKNVSLGTSKNNYIDPRIIFVFIKKFEIPPEKLFTSTLIKRFQWASKVDTDWRF